MGHHRVGLRVNGSRSAAFYSDGAEGPVGESCDLDDDPRWSATIEAQRDVAYAETNRVRRHGRDRRAVPPVLRGDPGGSAFYAIVKCFYGIPCPTYDIFSSTEHSSNVAVLLERSISLPPARARNGFQGYWQCLVPLGSRDLHRGQITQRYLGPSLLLKRSPASRSRARVNPEQ